MKKLLCVLLALCLSIPLFACGEVKQTNRSLTIFAPTPELQEVLEMTLRRYRSANPEIDVQLMELPDGCPVFDQEAAIGDKTYLAAYQKELAAYHNETLPKFYDSVRNDLITGKGPDLLLIDDSVFDDIYKVTASGVFYDLNEAFDADPDFHREEYAEPVLRAGQYRDKQLTVPLFCDFGMLLTTEEALRRTSADPTQFDACNRLLKEAARLTEAEPELRFFYSPEPVRNWLDYSGLQPVDYARKQASLDTPEFRSIQDSYRTLEQAGALEEPAPNTDSVLKRLEHSAVVSSSNASYLLIQSLQLILEEQTPRLFPLRTVDGGIQANVRLSAAIRGGSENRQNAYDFLKLLMGSEFQSADAYSGYLPLRQIDPESRIDLLQIQYPALERLPEQYAADYAQWIGEIDSVAYPSPLSDSIAGYFAPYIRDEASYEDCLKKAEQELAIYVSE